MVLSIRITKSILAGNQPFGWKMIISLSQQITACVINTCMQGKTTLRTTVRYAASLTPCNECMHVHGMHVHGMLRSFERPLHHDRQVTGRRGLKHVCWSQNWLLPACMHASHVLTALRMHQQPH